jgi:hypothetical protein
MGLSLQTSVTSKGMWSTKLPSSLSHLDLRHICENFHAKSSHVQLTCGIVFISKVVRGQFSHISLDSTVEEDDFKHILVLPRCIFGSSYASFWFIMSAHYKPKTCTTWVPSVSGHHPSFLDKDGSGHEQTRGKKEALYCLQ